MSRIDHMPLERLLVQLQAAGFKISPSDRMRVQQLLADQVLLLTTKAGQAAFMYQLAPILAQSATEQEHFYRIYKDYLTDIQVPMDDLEEPPVEIVPPSSGNTWKWWWIVPLIIVLLAGIGLEIVSKKSSSTFYFTSRNDQRAFAPGDDIYLDNQSSTDDNSDYTFNWQLIDTATQNVVDSFSGYNWHFTAKGDSFRTTYSAQMEVVDDARNVVVKDAEYLSISCLGPPQIERGEIQIDRDTIEANTNITFFVDLEDYGRAVRYNWNFGNGDETNEARPVRSFEKQEYTIRLTVSDTNDVTCSSSASLKFDLSDEIPPLQPKLLKQDDESLAQFSLEAWLICIFLALSALAWLWYWWRDQKRQAANERLAVMQMGKQFQAPDKPPYEPPFRSKNDRIQRESRQFAIANVLRQRELGQRRFLDVKATLNATVQKGGFPEVRYQYRSRPSDYLVLLDRQEPNGHLVQLFKHLVTLLRQQDVYIDLFYFDGTLDWVWTDELDSEISLDQLNRSFPERRLVIMGDGREWLEELDPDMSDPEWLVALRQWSRKIMITPIPMRSWSPEEAQLYQLIAVFPADFQHLLNAAAFIEGGMDEASLPNTFREWEIQLERNRFDVSIDRSWRERKDFQDYLKNHPEVFRWLQALVVHPEPNWNITIAIGKALGVAVTYDHLLLLSRIPWLNEEPMRLGLWREFWKYLSLGEERIARQAVLDELEAIANKHPDSFANQQLQMELAIQKFALDPLNPKNQQQIQFLHGDGFLDDRRLEELDLILKRQLENTADLEGLKPGDVLRLFLADKEVKPEPYNVHFFGGLTTLLLSILTALLLLGLLGWTADDFQDSQWLVDAIPSEKAQLNNAAKDIYDGIFANFATDKNTLRYDSSQFNRADALLAQALAMDTNYAVAQFNQSLAEYNKGIAAYYVYHEDRENNAGPLALDHFINAQQSDSTNVEAMALHGVGLMYHYLGENDSVACIILDQWRNLRGDAELIYPNLETITTCVGPPQFVNIFYNNEWEIPLVNYMTNLLGRQSNIVINQQRINTPNSRLLIQSEVERPLSVLVAKQLKDVLLLNGFKVPESLTAEKAEVDDRLDNNLTVYLNLPEPVEVPETFILQGQVFVLGPDDPLKKVPLTEVNEGYGLPLSSLSLNLLTQGQGSWDISLDDNSRFELQLPLQVSGTSGRFQLSIAENDYFDSNIALSNNEPIEIVLDLLNGFTPLPNPPYPCRQIANVNFSIGFRNRPLTQAELSQVNGNPNNNLARATFIADIPLDETVELIDSSDNLYRIRYQNQVGYIAISYGGNSTLGPCPVEGPPPPEIPDHQMSLASNCSNHRHRLHL